MAKKKNYWFKMANMWFQDHKIVALRQSDKGLIKAYLWSCLLGIASESKADGKLSLAGKAYSFEVIASLTGVKENLIEEAIETMLELELLEKDGDFLKVKNFREFQDLDKLEKDRERKQLKKKENAFSNTDKSFDYTEVFNGYSL